MYQFQLDSANMLTPSVKHFRITPTQDALFDYLPGQFITIHFEHQGKTLRRSYSIANAPQDQGYIEFAASYVESGPGTAFLFSLKTGDTVQITGPFGRLTLKDTSPKRYIFIATSTGVTPYRSMIPSLQQRIDADPRLNVVILEGVQKQQDVLYEQDFLNWAARTPQVLFRTFLSRETSPIDQTHIRHGHVQVGFEELDLNPNEDHIYLCGNPAMIDDSFTQLKDLGFPSQNIIREKYISSK